MFYFRKKYQVYADDRIVIKIKENKIEGYGTPWNTKNQKYCINNSTYIKKIYFLHHGRNDLQDNIENLGCLLKIAKQILHCKFYPSKEIFGCKMKISKALMSKCKCFSFGFFPDESCIKYLVNNDE